MTLDHERMRAMKGARRFLFELLDPKATPGVPKAVRQAASRWLKHFPEEWWVDEVTRVAGGFHGGDWGNLVWKDKVGE